MNPEVLSILITIIYVSDSIRKAVQIISDKLHSTSFIEKNLLVTSDFMPPQLKGLINYGHFL